MKGDDRVSKLMNVTIESSSFQPGDVLSLRSEQKGDKLIFVGNESLVVFDSNDTFQCIPIEKNPNTLQNYIITQLTDSITKIGIYTEDGNIILDEKAST